MCMFKFYIGLVVILTIGLVTSSSKTTKSVCKGNPCGKHGTCNKGSESALCTCHDGWFGEKCEQTDLCAKLRPCQNKGICSNKQVLPDFNIDKIDELMQNFDKDYFKYVDSYSCQCVDGWAGQNCTVNICHTENPCQHNGICKSPTILSFEDDMKDGEDDMEDGEDYGMKRKKRSAAYKRTDDVDSDYDSDSDILQEIQEPLYECECVNNWVGRNCTIDLCLTERPCQNGGVCTNLYSYPNDDDDVSYSCECVSPWIGNDCTSLALIPVNFTGHSSYVYAMTYLSTGMLASGSKDKTIKVWNSDGTVNKSLLTNDKVNSPLVALPHGNLAVVFGEKDIKVWNVSTGVVYKNLTSHTKKIVALVVLQTGEIVSGSLDYTIKVWDASSGNVKKSISTPTNDTITTLCVLKSGELANGFKDADITVRNALTGTVSATWSNSKFAVSIVQLPNGDVASSHYVSDYNTYFIYIWKNGVIEKELNGNLVSSENEAPFLAALSNGYLVAAIGTDIEMLNIENEAAVNMWTATENDITAIVVLPNGLLASSATEKTIKIWDISRF